MKVNEGGCEEEQPGCESASVQTARTWSRCYDTRLARTRLTAIASALQIRDPSVYRFPVQLELMDATIAQHLCAPAAGPQGRWPPLILCEPAM